MLSDECDAVEIKGLLYVPEYGRYNFSAGGSRYSITLNGDKAAYENELYKGYHYFVISVKNPGETLSLKWKKNDEQIFSEIPARNMLNSEKLYGLIATYINDGKPYYKMIETMIDYRSYYWKLRPPYDVNKATEYMVEWKGFLDMKKDGEYEFLFEALDDSEINIDGKNVYLFRNGKEIRSWIRLKPGKKRIYIKAKCGYTSTIWENATIRLMYREKGTRLFQPVSYSSLYPY